MSQSKATAKPLAQSHIRMYTSISFLNKFIDRRGSRNKLSSAFLIILAVILAFVATSCGSGGTSPAGNVPVANAGGPYLGNVNQALAFNGSGSSAPSGRTLTSFAWIFGDGSNGVGASVSHAYTVAGNYTATLTVTDSSGTTGSSSVAVQIITAPVSRPGGPYTGKVGTPVSFNGSASTAPPGQALGFSWNFGDGSGAGSGATPTHTYGNACTCTVTLTVTDDTAGTSLATTTATIAAGPAPGGESPTPATFFAIGPAANPSSQFAYMLTTSSSGTSSLTIETIDNATGALNPADVTPPSLDNNFVPAGMIADPSRKFLYVYSGNSVQTFSIAPDSGSLISSGLTPTNGSPDVPTNQALVFSPNGKLAFFVTQDADAADPNTPGSVTSFSVAPSTGALVAIETVSSQVSRAQSAVIDPAGKFLYVSGFAPTTSTTFTSTMPQIAILAVSQDTAGLNPISESPLAVESGVAATSMAFDSTGRFIYAAGKNSSTNSAALSVFPIDSTTGSFTQSVAPTPLSDPSSGESVTAATSLILSPSARFAYVLATVIRGEAAPQQAIQMFELNGQTGAPKFDSSAVTNNVAADPTTFLPSLLFVFSPNQISGTAGNSGFLLLTNPSDASVLLFSADAKTGLLNFRSATNTAAH